MAGGNPDQTALSAEPRAQHSRDQRSSSDSSTAHLYFYQELRASCGESKANEWLLRNIRSSKASSGQICRDKERRRSLMCLENATSVSHINMRNCGLRTRSTSVDLQIQPPSPQSIRSEDSVMDLKSIYKSLIEQKCTNSQSGITSRELMESDDSKCFLGLLFTSEACNVLDKCIT
ncbi:hypothetical protein GUITHDRAFT_106586 [Guillardia theta CCMP2712]|uniref:Uncharacterized protein n=2 Tax=Guillardia theta TaxID=55529 RepID=L1JHH8_GUITC|nr:hypothetical protein GUITHDRAFT_106586 [Guillardia theta CCMP2712]EKX47599.1 hypothetical protein GUITHDRAFT_106586 [Guillardia theta CCMP2712]|eukprot:XP_005834579.1 hypothetical protein GUITHDRAFT_106586 [Guillardia theta CCMP2712]